MSTELPAVTMVPAPGVLRRSVGGVTVLALETDTDPPLRLGPLASLVWACLEVGGTSVEIAADIMAEFPQATVEALISDDDVDAGPAPLASRCVAAVERTLWLLREHGLVVPISDPPPGPLSHTE